MKLILVSGGFDPLHKGHLDMLTSARQLGDRLSVGLNSDEWLTRKKGAPFMSFNDRMDILMELECVDHVVPFDDSDDTANDFIRTAISTHGTEGNQFVFVNGGDRGPENIPELDDDATDSLDIDLDFVFDVGGEKSYSSSDVNIVQRKWGEYKVVHKEEEALVKLLTIEVGEEISYQRHFYRGEIWHIIEGQAMVKTSRGRPQNYQFDYLTSGQHFGIIPYQWHQVKNVGKVPLRIIEIQQGSYIGEDDIEREETLH
jgi:cytidyltransferase-like protein